MSETWPVELKLVAIIRDEEGESLATIEVDNTKPAPMQALNLKLDELGLSPLFHGANGWRVSLRGERRA